MEKHEWVNWITFLITAEGPPQDEDEKEIANGELVKMPFLIWDETYLN